MPPVVFRSRRQPQPMTEYRRQLKIRAVKPRRKNIYLTEAIGEKLGRGTITEPTDLEPADNNNATAAGKHVPTIRSPSTTSTTRSIQANDRLQNPAPVFEVNIVLH